MASGIIPLDSSRKRELRNAAAAGKPAANMAAAAAALAVDVGLMAANDGAPQLANMACCNDV
ncbi:hypothetical protein DERF_000296 [Dermatophagoides farinae]|uniref:Uncharacterized protein n=1 Tax=Dermatophagoides farinae TaxID=6954 RepID=A0A922LCD5_DERFA|nr:hypothetical protein DERF_000296 [Dermatophagoides farinae]